MSITDVDMFLEDAETETSEAEKFFKQIEALAQRAASLDAEAEQLEDEAARLRQLSSGIRTVDLPEMMKKARVDKLRLQDGSEATVKEIIKGSIPEHSKEAAFNWLRSHNFGTLIKNQISLQLGKGEDEKAAEIRKFLEDEGVAFDFKETVHPMTLNAFVKEQLTRGTNLPEAIQVFQRTEVQIKSAK